MAGNSAERVSARLKVIQQRAAGPAPRAACQAMTQDAETITKLVLSRSSHKAGTKTPSQPGQPPAMVSGRLRNAIQRTPAASLGPGIWRQALVCLVPWGKYQNDGVPEIRARNKKVLANRATGQVFGPGPIKLPARPWIRPSVELTRMRAPASARAAFLRVLFGGLRDD